MRPICSNQTNNFSGLRCYYQGKQLLVRSVKTVMLSNELFAVQLGGLGHKFRLVLGKIDRAK
jgi:hypothetical protein